MKAAFPLGSMNGSCGFAGQGTLTTTISEGGRALSEVSTSAQEGH